MLQNNLFFVSNFKSLFQCKIKIEFSSTKWAKKSNYKKIVKNLTLKSNFKGKKFNKLLKKHPIQNGFFQNSFLLEEMAIVFYIQNVSFAR